MSIVRQNSSAQFPTSGLSRLNAKEGQINRLQNQVADLTQAKLDYAHSTEALDQLKRKISHADQENQKTRWATNQAKRATESTLKSAKTEFENLSMTLKGKQSDFNQLLADKKDFHQVLLQKDSQIERLSTRGDIEQHEGYLAAQQENLLQQQYLAKVQLKQLDDDLVATEKKNRDIAKNVATKESLITSLKLQVQNKDRKLDLYERENNALDCQIEESMSKEEGLLRLTCDNENLMKDLAVEEVGLKSTVKRLEAELEDLVKRTKLFEKERNKEARQAVKAKETELKRISQAQEQEQYEINTLLNKNADISQINGKLRTDVDFCDEHLISVKRCNQLMVEFLEKCKNEDKNLIQMIQKRVQGATIATQKSTIVPNQTNNSKMGYSRSTQHSAWLDL